MTVRFRTLCSGSSGNSVVIRNDSTMLLIDCGFRAQYRCRDMLDAYASDPPPAAVVVSHLHTDHICYSGLRVIEERGIPLYIHEESLPELAGRHYRNRTFEELEIRAFGEEAFEVGDFVVRAVPVSHAPCMTAHGFVVTRGKGRKKVRIVIATDLTKWGGDIGDFVGADLVYVEANHDPELLRANPNLNSQYHMENSRTARLLCEALDRCRRPPQAIMLAHLSEQRNTPEIALNTARAILDESGHSRIPLLVAPRHEPSDEIAVG